MPKLENTSFHYTIAVQPDKDIITEHIYFNDLTIYVLFEMRSTLAFFRIANNIQSNKPIISLIDTKTKGSSGIF